MTEPSDPQFQIVVGVLRDVDAEGLIRMGAPQDEYEPEAESLALLLHKGEPITAESVREVWQKWFGTGTRPDGSAVKISDMAMRPEFERIAQMIRERVAVPS